MGLAFRTRCAAAPRLRASSSRVSELTGYSPIVSPVAGLTLRATGWLRTLMGQRGGAVDARNDRGDLRMLGEQRSTGALPFLHRDPSRELDEARRGLDARLTQSGSKAGQPGAPGAVRLRTADDPDRAVAEADQMLDRLPR